MTPQNKKSDPPANGIENVLAKKPILPSETMPVKRPFTLLCVDDDPPLLRMEKRMIEPLGHNVETVASGAEALERVRKGGISLVLSDFQMPGMNGAKLLEAVKKVDPGIAVIIISSTMTTELTRSLMNNGASLILEKPIAQEDLREAVTNVLATIGPIGQKPETGNE